MRLTLTLDGVTSAELPAILEGVAGSLRAGCRGEGSIHHDGRYVGYWRTAAGVEVTAEPRAPET